MHGTILLLYYLYPLKQPEFKMEYIKLTYRKIEKKIKVNLTCTCTQAHLNTHSCSWKGCWSLSTLSGFIIIALTGMVTTCQSVSWIPYGIEYNYI